MENYQVLHLIGEGCFGKVFKGRRKFTGQAVALKFISTRGKSDKDLKNLRSEMSILKQLSHENIIRLIDAFETANDFVVVTEYGHGELFEVFQDDKRLPEKEVRKIAIQLVKALFYLHSNRVIHRDMKPQNILISSNNIIKLCDFGFARAMSNKTVVLNSVKGTPLYMAPELVQEQPYNHTADLWSLGVILYELFVGTPPFYTNSLYSLINLIINDPVKYPSNMSAEFRSFLQGLLQKDPKKRSTWPNLLHHPFVSEPADESSTTPPPTISTPTHGGTGAVFEESISLMGKSPFDPKSPVSNFLSSAEYVLENASRRARNHTQVAGVCTYLIGLLQYISSEKSGNIWKSEILEKTDSILSSVVVIIEGIVSTIMTADDDPQSEKKLDHTLSELLRLFGLWVRETPPDEKIYVSFFSVAADLLKVGNRRTQQNALTNTCKCISVVFNRFAESSATLFDPSTARLGQVIQLLAGLVIGGSAQSTKLSRAAIHAISAAVTASPINSERVDASAVSLTCLEFVRRSISSEFILAGFNHLGDPAALQLLYVTRDLYTQVPVGREIGDKLLETVFSSETDVIAQCQAAGLWTAKFRALYSDISRIEEMVLSGTGSAWSTVYRLSMLSGVNNWRAGLLSNFILTLPWSNWTELSQMDDFRRIEARPVGVLETRVLDRVLALVNQLGVGQKFVKAFGGTRAMVGSCSVEFGLSELASIERLELNDTLAVLQSVITRKNEGEGHKIEHAFDSLLGNLVHSSDHSTIESLVNSGGVVSGVIGSGFPVTLHLLQFASVVVGAGGVTPFMNSGGLKILKAGFENSEWIGECVVILSNIARHSAEWYPVIHTELRPYSALERWLADPTSPELQARTCSAIGNMSRHSDFFYMHFEPLILALVSVCQSTDTGCRKFASFAIGNVAFHSGALYESLRRAGAVRTLVRLLRDEDEKTRANSAGALGNMVRNGTVLVGEMIRDEVPEGLLGLLIQRGVGSDSSGKIALFSLGNLATHKATKDRLVKLGCSEIVRKIVVNGDKQVIKYADRLFQKLSN
jgi:serine/threonine protein kinase